MSTIKYLIFYPCLICLVPATRACVTYVLVEEGETTEFKVNKTKDSLVRWVKGEGPTEEVLKEYGGPIKSGYSFSCKDHACVMKIKDVHFEQAGLYEFREIKKENRHLTTFQLLVGDIECSLNVHKKKIGRNDCYGVQADKVDRKCRLSFAGSRDYKPTIKWGIVGNNNDQVVEAFNMTRERGLNVWEVEDKVTVDSDKTTYKAYVIGSSCISLFSLPRGFVLNAMNTTEPHLTSSMKSTNKRNLTCKATQSSNVHYSYKWIFYTTEDPNLEKILTIYQGAKLWSEDINKTGSYECHALCRLGKHQCTILADSFVFSTSPIISSSESSFSNNIVWIGVVIIVISLLLIGYMVFRYVKSRHNGSRKIPLQNF